MNFITKLFGKTANASRIIASQSISAADLLEISSGKQKLTKSIEELSDDIDQLGYDKTLKLLASNEGKLHGLAIRRIAKLIDDGDLDLQQLCKDFPKLSHQLSVASFSRSQDTLESLLKDIDDEDTLIELCENTPASSVRIKLLEKIHSYEALKKLEKSLKHRDKSCLKKIKIKLDAIKKQKAARVEHEQLKTRILQELSDHSSRSFCKDYEARYQSLQRKVEDIERTDDTQWSINARALLDKCKEIVNTNKLSNRVSPPTEKVDESADSATDLSLAKQYCTHMNLILTPKLKLDDLLALQETQEDLAAQCEAYYMRENDSEALLGELRTLTEAIEAYVFLIKEDIDVRNALTYLLDENVNAKDLQQSIRQINRAKAGITNNSAFKRFVGLSPLCNVINEKQQKLAEIEKQEQKQNQQIVGLIRKAHFAVKNGRLKQAQGIRHTISELIDEKQYLPSYIERQWSQLTEEVKELSDWHAYASTPKLQTLLNDMQQLAQRPEAPELQATKIKRLQDEWKVVTKGSGGAHQEKWTEFKAAADQAFQVCDAHYQQLDKERRENTEKAETLIHQLQLYVDQYDWNNANWNEVETVLHTAKKTWRGYKPVLQSKQKILREGFNKQVSNIQKYLNDEYAKNKADKLRLVDSLKQCIGSVNLDDEKQLDDIIKTTINFQKQWKKIGHCQRSDEQALWRDFRSLCDKVFQKRDAVKENSRAITNQAIQNGEEIIARLNDIYSHDGDSFDQACASLEDMVERFEKLEGIPEKIQKSLNHKFRKACNDIEKKKQVHQQHKQESDWLQLFAYKQKLNSALFAGDSEKAQDIGNQLRAESLHSSCKNALLNTLKNNTTEAQSDYYRLLCVKAEVFSETPTPKEDSALRMRFQVEHLQNNFGSTQQSALALAEEWFSGPGIDEQSYLQLASRFTPQWMTLLQAQTA